MLRWLAAGFTFLALLLVMLVVGAWIAAPYLVEQFSPGLAQSKNLDDFSIEIRELGLGHAVIDAIGFTTTTPAGRLNVNIKDSVVDFDITHFTASRIRIADARIEYFPSSSGPDESDDGIQLPVIPVAELIIERADLTIHGERGPVHLDGRLKITQPEPGQFRFDFRDASYTYNGLLTPSPLTIELVLSEKSDAVVATLDYRAEPDATRINADLKPLLTWYRAATGLPLPALPQDITLEQGQLNITIQNLATPVDTHANGLLNLTQLEYASQQIDATLPFAITQADQNIDLEFTDQAHIRLQKPDSYAIDLEFEPHYQVHASLNENNTLSMARGKGRVHANLSLPEANLNAAIKHWQLGHWTAGQPLPDTVEIDLRDLTGTALPPITLHGKWQSTHDVVKGTGTARIGDAIPLQWRSNHQLPSWTTQVNASLDLRAADFWTAIQDILDRERPPINVYTGQTKASAQLRWSPKDGVSAQGKLSARNVSARIDNLDLSQADITLSIDDLLAPRGHFQVSVPQTTLANGLQTGPFETSGDFGDDYAEVTKATLDLYSGQLSMQPARVYFDETTNQLAVDVRTLDIGALMSDFGPGNIEVSGGITGSLPITINQAGFAIHDAIISNDGPGIVRYQSGMGNDQNIAFKALDNFHYKYFTAHLDYTADGDYTLKIRFNGKNPDLYGGHPIEFNLNLEGNLPGFLRASILSGDIADEAIKTLKRHNLQHAQ